MRTLVAQSLTSGWCVQWCGLCSAADWAGRLMCWFRIYKVKAAVND